VREYCETWLNKCYARLAFTLSDIIGLEVTARKAMEKAAKELDFMQAAKLRDEIKSLQEKI
jgi:excinuclease UvrABC nuclease subunit